MKKAYNLEYAAYISHFRNSGCARETLQNLLYFWNMYKNPNMFFRSSIRTTLDLLQHKDLNEKTYIWVFLFQKYVKFFERFT